jgi:hypothetical protein
MPIVLRTLPLALGIGTGSGALLLGVGGRFAMRLIALAGGRPGSFSLRGTLTVVLAGAVAGLVGGVLFWAVQRYLPGHTLSRGAVFGILCLAIAAPGIRPPRALAFGAFAPFFLAYGVLVASAWARWSVVGREPPGRTPGS